ncbi:MAG TPA: ECF transporter S component [Actinomycetales bacterium]|nr:ECF transporter S component [Actinomycetales bacterium]
MTSTEPRETTHDATRPSAQGAAIALTGVVAAVAIVVAGFPGEQTLFGSDPTNLTVPAALLVALVGLWVGGWTTTTRPRWRVVDIVVASVIGVVGGFVFFAWNAAWLPLSTGLTFFPPASGILVGVWLLPGVLGGLIIRRPGAALYTELVAATLSALLGNQWGFATVWYGFLEGMGAEVVFALLLFRRWGLGAALGAGAGAGVVVGLLDAFVYYPAFSPGYKAVYVAATVVSGVVIAGLGAWALTRSIAATGALAPLASGRDARRV